MTEANVQVDQSICIGCRMCNNIYPEVFDMVGKDGEEKSFVKKSLKDENLDQGEIDHAIECCPVDCISRKR